MLFVSGWFFLASLDLSFANQLNALREESAKGLVAYFLITVMAVVAAPLATLPLTPLAASIWGWWPVLLVSVAAWQTGAIIDFWLARKFGRWLIGKFANLKKVDELTARFPQKEQFITVFLLRMIIPVDILSYALGLTNISWRVYFWATFLGIIPFAFIFSYGGGLIDSAQIISLVAGGILLFWVVGRALKRRMRTGRGG